MKKIHVICVVLLLVAGKVNYCCAQNVALTKQYSNTYFCLNYPSSWQIVQDDNQATANTAIAVQVMEKQSNNIDFRPNVNVIVSNKKWKESTSYLAKQSSQNNRQIISTYRQIGIYDTQIGNYKGSLLEYIISIDGYTLHGRQYIVKKTDNTTFTITATTDERKDKNQMKVVQAILNSFKIK